MHTIATNIRLQFNENHNAEIVLTVKGHVEIAELKDVVSRGKELTAEVKQYRHKRSLDANAYIWVMLSKMAAVMNTTKDELYLLMLERYGVFTHIVVKPNVVERVKAEWRTVRELGEVIIKGQTGIQLQCFFGSSTYDTKEMSVLIDGVVNECKELGIEVLTPRQLSLLKSEWGK